MIKSLFVEALGQWQDFEDVDWSLDTGVAIIYDTIECADALWQSSVDTYSFVFR